MDKANTNKTNRRNICVFMIWIAVLALIVVCLFFVESSLVTSNARKGVKLILISVDGLRHDMISHHATPNLAQLSDSGVSCPMCPAYPSTTFPNHFTMITGLHPNRHGIIGNVFFDSQRNKVFDSRNIANKDFGEWLQEGEPIWNTLERNGGRSAVIQWVGSDAVYQGKKASVSIPFKKERSPSQITDLILEFVGEDSPVNFVVGYYSIVDAKSHKFGPNSPQELQALVDVDKQIGRIVERINQQSMKEANLIVLSDHGTSQVTKRIQLSKLVSDYDSRLRFASCSPITFIYPHNHNVDEIIDELEEASKAYKDSLTVYRNATLPKRWNFDNNHRIPPIVIQANLGTKIECDIGRTEEEGDNGHDTGDHGFDPIHKDMRAVFIAKGPQFKADTLSLSRQDEKSNNDIPDTVDVYRVLAKCLNLPIHEKIQSGERLEGKVVRLTK